MNLSWAPVVPSAPAKQTDRQWIGDFQRRHAVAGTGTQSAVLARAWVAAADSGERRERNRGTARQLAAEAREDEALARYQRDRREVLGMIGRMKRGARSGPAAPAGVISRSAAASLGACRHCADCGFSPEESRQVHQGWAMVTAAGHQQ